MGVPLLPLVLIATLGQLQGTPSDAKRDYAYKRTLATAYLYQGNARYGALGKSFCGPTAAAMGFSWLIDNGYPKLLPEGKDKLDSLQRIVELLGSESYMGTDPVDGTSTGKMIMGIGRYVADAGYRVGQISYAGWRPAPAGTPGTLVSQIPHLGLVRSGVDDPRSIVFLNVGFYLQGDVPGAWRRTAGHWVTVVGYGTKGDGKADPSVLLLHNPSVGMPKEAGSSRKLLERLAPDVAVLTPVEGQIYTSKGQPVRSASGMFSVEGPALPKPRNHDIAIVDGVLILSLS